MSQQPPLDGRLPSALLPLHSQPYLHQQGCPRSTAFKGHTSAQWTQEQQSREGYLHFVKPPPPLLSHSMWADDQLPPGGLTLHQKKLDEIEHWLRSALSRLCLGAAPGVSSSSNSLGGTPAAHSHVALSAHSHASARAGPRVPVVLVLTGPAGCGKTAAVAEIAQRMRLNLLEAPGQVSGSLDTGSGGGGGGDSSMSASLSAGALSASMNMYNKGAHALLPPAGAAAASFPLAKFTSFMTQTCVKAAAAQQLSTATTMMAMSTAASATAATTGISSNSAKRLAIMGSSMGSNMGSPNTPSLSGVTTPSPLHSVSAPLVVIHDPPVSTLDPLQMGLFWRALLAVAARTLTPVVLTLTTVSEAGAEDEATYGAPRYLQCSNPLAAPYSTGAGALAALKACPDIKLLHLNAVAASYALPALAKVLVSKGVMPMSNEDFIKASAAVAAAEAVAVAAAAAEAQTVAAAAAAAAAAATEADIESEVEYRIKSGSKSKSTVSLGGLKGAHTSKGGSSHSSSHLSESMKRLLTVGTGSYGSGVTLGAGIQGRKPPGVSAALEIVTKYLLALNHDYDLSMNNNPATNSKSKAKGAKAKTSNATTTTSSSCDATDSTDASGDSASSHTPSGACVRLWLSEDSWLALLTAAAEACGGDLRAGITQLEYALIPLIAHQSDCAKAIVAKDGAAAAAAGTGATTNSLLSQLPRLQSQSPRSQSAGPQPPSLPASAASAQRAVLLLRQRDTPTLELPRGATTADDKLSSFHGLGKLLFPKPPPIDAASGAAGDDNSAICTETTRGQSTSMCRRRVTNRSSHGTASSRAYAKAKVAAAAAAAIAVEPVAVTQVDRLRQWQRALSCAKALTRSSRLLTSTPQNASESADDDVNAAAAVAASASGVKLLSRYSLPPLGCIIPAAKPITTVTTKAATAKASKAKAAAAAAAAAVRDSKTPTVSATGTITITTLNNHINNDNNSINHQKCSISN